MKHVFTALALIASVAAPAAGLPSIAEQTKDATKIDGFIPLYWNETEGTLMMEISRFDEEILLVISLPAGLGSNPVGLDRGQLGSTHVIRFSRIGNKVVMTEPNYAFRAISDDPEERQSVIDSFASGTLWGFTVAAETGDRVLVDATSFFLRDAHGAINTLADTGQGSYTLDESRSYFWLPRTRGFPKNTEVEVSLTLTTANPKGGLVRGVAATPAALTIREHFSFVELPGPGYEPRRFDPRAGSFGITFYDFASPVTDPIEVRWIARHRLEKKDPSAAISEPVEPIVYYLDRGTPEPIRSALLDGARWWNEGFEAAGFRNALRVEVLPPDADPMDVRYNMINWVHRSTRGWSYGAGVVDPRTGEIIKGNVTLGSLRVRQDVLLGTGLVTLFGDPDIFPDFDYISSLDPSRNVAAMALARIRQLSAHEVGHTLGLAHNFAASTYDRGSVMDYPAPLVEIRDGQLDLSNAYDSGLGVWDVFAMRYAYSDFPPGTDVDAALEAMIADAVERGLLFITDADARPPGAAHPLANLWDNGSDPVEALRHTMEVRRIALGNFGLSNLEEGRPLSLLEAKLLPLYLHHRYQTEATVKTVGGIHYSYAVRKRGGSVPADAREIVDAETQREALKQVLSTLTIDELRLPDRIVEMIPPAAWAYSGRTIELFDGRMKPAFDPLAAAQVAADFAVSGLLEPNRAARLVAFNASNPRLPGFEEVVTSLVDQSWERGDDQTDAAIGRAVQHLIALRLIDLVENRDANFDVRAIAASALRRLTSAESSGRVESIERSHRALMAATIQRFFDRPWTDDDAGRPLPAPPGSPIGSVHERN